MHKNTLQHFQVGQVASARLPMLRSPMASVTVGSISYRLPQFRYASSAPVYRVINLLCVWSCYFVNTKTQLFDRLTVMYYLRALHGHVWDTAWPGTVISLWLWRMLR